jgi:hypothetical protein
MQIDQLWTRGVSCARSRPGQRAFISFLVGYVILILLPTGDRADQSIYRHSCHMSPLLNSFFCPLQIATTELVLPSLARWLRGSGKTRSLANGRPRLGGMAGYAGMLTGNNAKATIVRITGAHNSVGVRFRSLIFRHVLDSSCWKPARLVLLAPGLYIVRVNQHPIQGSSHTNA